LQTYSEDEKAANSLLARLSAADSGADRKAKATLAAWTSVGRVIFNLDDFMTRE
jgi:hypothetical protein